MDWTRAVDGYCERLSPDFWAEPVNAATNAAFLLAALVMWGRVGAEPLARLLCGLLFTIGVGSFLFHTFAEVWAGVADVLPIVLFILTYIFAINRVGWGLGFWQALGATALFLPYAAALTPVFAAVPGLGGSAAYAPVPLLIAIYALLLRHRDRLLSRGLAVGAALLVVSLTFRTVDGPLCEAMPLGTHFLWHLLNAVMLGWMIEVYARAALGKAGAAE